VFPQEVTLMMRSLILVAVLLGSLGCTKYVVRDTVVYQVELNQYDAWATKQAALLKGFVTAHCTCTELKQFATLECAQAVDYILVIEARAAWHKDMSLFLAGITETRPPRIPPMIPASSTLCPKGDQ
jgi:hypothetical protein